MIKDRNDVEQFCRTFILVFGVDANEFQLVQTNYRIGVVFSWVTFNN
jgi:hypothetical protein